MKKTLTRSQLIKRLDRLCSIIVRYGYAKEKNGKLYCLCWSTQRWYPIDKVDAGHFIQRGCLPLRFDLRNLHAESQKANRFSADHLAGYANSIVDVYGKKELERLVNTKRKWEQGKVRVSVQELRDIYNKRAKQAKPIIEKYNLKVPKSWYNGSV